VPHSDPIKRKEYAKAYREANKEEHKKYQAEYRKNHDSREYKREYHKNKRFDKYGITKEFFEKMLEMQNFSCEICQMKFDDKHRPYIDHCHRTNKVRGLLCMHCNTGLGHFEDDPELLKSAMEYLVK